MLNRANAASGNGAATMAVRKWRLVAGVCAAFLATQANALITVGPDSDPACNFHDIQSAVFHAAQSPGFDIVAITSGAWTAQSTIVVSDAGDLTIEGGFANCSAGISTGRTELNGAGAQPRGSLIRHQGDNHLTLLNLDIAQGTATNGGGVDSEGGGRLTLSDVQLRTNHADFGGGVFALGSGAGNPHKVVELIGVAFVSNSANAYGGGLYARDSDVTIRSARVDNYFLENNAQGASDAGDGGAMYLYDSNLDASAHGIAGGDVGFMTQNTASRNGGGIFARSTGTQDMTLVVGNDDATYPLRFTTNAASLGAVVYLQTASSARMDMTLSNAIVDHNTSADGVLLVDAAAAGSVARLRMEQTPSIYSSSPPCARSVECNTFDQNIARNGDLIDLVSDGGRPEIELVRARVRNNNAHEGLIFGTGAAVRIDGSLMAKNTLGQRVVSNDTNYIRIVNSTVAGNSYPAGNAAVQMVTSATLNLEQDLFADAGHPVCSVGAGVVVSARDIGVADAGGADCLPADVGSNIQHLSDPFVDGTGGNFHLRPDSSAVDRWKASADPTDPPPALDLDGLARPQVVASGTTTPYDFGAYEAQLDTILIDGFDG